MSLLHLYTCVFKRMHRPKQCIFISIPIRLTMSIIYGSGYLLQSRLFINLCFGSDDNLILYFVSTSTIHSFLVSFFLLSPFSFSSAVLCIVVLIRSCSSEGVYIFLKKRLKKKEPGSHLRSCLDNVYFSISNHAFNVLCRPIQLLDCTTCTSNAREDRVAELAINHQRVR